MALNFKGTTTSTALAALEHDDVQLKDAYRVDNNGTISYKYCTDRGVQEDSTATPPVVAVPPTFTDYIPIKVIDDLALNTTYEGSGVPTATSNTVQFPTLKTGIFYLDGTTGDVWAYVDGTTGWNKW